MPTRAAVAASQPAQTINISAPPPPAPPEKPEKPAEQEERPPRWFFDRLAEIPMGDWGRVWSIELHRLEPSVPGQPGSKGYLGLFNAPVSLDQIKDVYGGGKFKMNLCKHGRWETSHEFTIVGPPKYDLSRENPGAANGNGNGNGHGEAKLIEIVQQQLQQLTAELVELRKGGGAGQDKAIDVVANGANKVIEMMKENGHGQNKSSSSDMREMIGTLKDLGIIGGAAHKSLAQELRELLTDPLVQPLIQGLFGPKDPIAEFSKIGTLIEAIDKLRGTSGGGGGGKSDWRTALVEEGIPAARDLITTIASNRDANMRIATEQRAAAEARERTASTVKDLQAQRAAAAHAPAAIQPTAPAPAAPAVGARPFRVVPIDDEQAAPEPAAAAAPASIQVNADEYLNGVKLRFVDLLRAGDDYEFIVDFLEGSGIELVTYLTQYTPAQIKLYCSQDPILAHAVALPRWDEFIEVAREYLEGELAEPPRAN
jgi:hypothetical protein